MSKIKPTVNRIFASFLGSGMLFNEAMDQIKFLHPSFDRELGLTIAYARRDIENYQLDGDDDYQREEFFDMQCSYEDLLNTGDLCSNATYV